MKIGVLTFHYCHNYGAMLQAFALKKALISLGYDVSFVDYELPWLTRRYTLFRFYMFQDLSLIKKIKKFFGTLKTIRRRSKKISNFRRFQRKYLGAEKLNSGKFDFVIVGSDQVWNPEITNGYDSMYWGMLVKKAGIPLMSYAASCPSKFFSEQTVGFLKNFRSIGVREKQMKSVLSDFGISSVLTIDPTLLLSKEEWEKFAGDERCIPQKYIFVYNVAGSAQINSVAKNFAQKKKLALIDASSCENERMATAAPREFVNIIMNAEYVFVSSFHGTAFSILLQKNFLYFPVDNEKDERAINLLYSTGLQDRIVSNDCFLFECDDVDWTRVNSKIQNMKKQSLEFIEQSVGGI